MAIRFRFRSSANFDSVDIEGRPSISVRDLKTKVVHNKNLNICQDFDLVLSDATTGQEYSDENFQLLSGSSVIIKRVPSGSVHSDIARGVPVKNVGIKDTNVVRTSAPVNVEIDNFDDFGADLCPIPEATISYSDLDVDKKLYFTSDKTAKEIPKCFEIPMVGYEKPEASELSEAIPRGPLCISDDKDASHVKSKPSVREFIKPERVVTANPVAIQGIDLPAELKCSLCDASFKEAMMIPCCQHSFCGKCIRLVLIEKGRCPKCLSAKYRVEDLLPNVSLRQAIERFLESQILIKGSDDAFGYAPDGESGIQVKEMSCAMSIQQRETELPHSPCSTGRGSNQIIPKSVNGKSSHSDKLRRTDAEKHGSKHLLDLERGPNLVVEFQGENQPLHEEAESAIKKKRAQWINSEGADRSFVETGRQRKGDRTCYMCGSPDHFIRDCPAAPSPHPMLQTGNTMFPGAMPGYLSPYWNRTPYPQIHPFANPYGNPFNATMVPPTTFAVPTYMPTMFSSMAPYGGFTRMANVASSVVPSAEWHRGHSDCRELQIHEKRQKISNDNLKREQYFDDDEDDTFNKRHYYNEVEKLNDPKSLPDKDDSISHSKASFTERPYGEHCHYNHFDDEPERSSSEVEDMPSSSDWHSEERHKHHHRNYNKHNGRGKQVGGDHSSHSHHQSTRTKDMKRKRFVSDAKQEKHKHNSQSESGLEPSLSSDQKTQCKQRDSSHGSRHSRSKHSSRSKNKESSHERWQMVSGSDEDGDGDGDGDCHYYKAKGLH